MEFYEKLAETAHEFIERVNRAAERGQIFRQYIGGDDDLGLFVEPDGSASVCIFDDLVDSVPAGSTPEQILDLWSHSVRKFAPSEDVIGTMSFVKDLKVNDLIIDEYDFNAKVIYVISDDEYIHVTTVSHGHPGGKQVKRFLKYPKDSMKTVDLLWAADGEIVCQED